MTGATMQLIEKTTDFQLHSPTAVALGKFDGVHVGHRFLLEEILKKKAEGLQTCVFTFDPPPAVLFGFSDGKELSTREEKRRVFKQLGVDILIEFPLTKQTADIPGEEFVRTWLCKKMQAKYLVAGEDLSFGRGGKGDAKLLRNLSGELGYQMRLIPKVCVDGMEVSSTEIRRLVEQGDMARAAQMLGTPYKVCGTVVKGNQIGRTLGFPTVNLLPPQDKLLPPNGVYAARVSYGGQTWRALSNVGYKPTVTDERVLGVESYLYDFNENIYGQEIQVELLEFRRPERRFDSLEALQLQLQQDILAYRTDARPTDIP